MENNIKKYKVLMLIVFSKLVIINLIGCGQNHHITSQTIASFEACSIEPPLVFSNKQVFMYTGTDQFFNFSSSSVCWVKIKAWGAGGGASFSHGGAGGYSEAYISKTDLPSTLLVVVGSGGNRWNEFAPTEIYGGGGKGGQTIGGRQGSSGGGLSGVFTSSSFTTSILSDAIIVAGAGAGIGKDDNFVKNPKVHGAPGGGLIAANGGNSLAATCDGGQGGSQLSGGTAGAGGSRPAEVGGPFKGGNGGGDGLSGGHTGPQGGGGGGAGYYGGGGGCGSGGHNFRESGGGAGSSFISPIDNGDGIMSVGVSRTPPNTTDVDYVPGVANGGLGSTVAPTNGGNGLIVFEWE